MTALAGRLADWVAERYAETVHPVVISTQRQVGLRSGSQVQLSLDAATVRLVAALEVRGLLEAAWVRREVAAEQFRVPSQDRRERESEPNGCASPPRI